ncbi:50S ribosomal protein L25 [Patescibacteria group bacterium]|nr:50S ribosomal protein L25 [Patescibacteria group bacterium]
MEIIEFDAKRRDIKAAKAKVVREAGLIPAVVYGANKENVHLVIDNSEFIKLYRKAGSNTIVKLKIGKESEENVLIYGVDHNAVTGDVNSVDFLRVRMDEKITTDVPVEFVGQSKAVKDLAGIFIANKDELEVTCLPTDLPKVIKVDITKLETFDDAFYVRDLVLPAGVVVDYEPLEVVATVVPPRSEEELAALDEEVEEDVDKVEVEEKGKKDEEEGQGETQEGEKPTEEKMSGEEKKK